MSRPTKQESEYIVNAKLGHCIPCLVRAEKADCPEGFYPTLHGDFHHTKSGNLRRGHMYGYCNCPWHHRQVPDFGCTVKEMRAWYGPSLMDGGKVFRDYYGTDDELIARQREYLGLPADIND